MSQHRKSCAIHKVTLNDLKLGTCCASNVQRIKASVFFPRNKFRIFFESAALLRATGGKKIVSAFMQNHATVCTQHNFMDVLHQVSSEQVLSQELWHPRLPDLNPSDVYLCDKLKKKTVYVYNPLSSESQQKMWRDISDTMYSCFHVSRNIFYVRHP
jgi:hypothetical protein